MNEKVEVGSLKIGMFVADLDRPWIESPFQLQGFTVETQQQIATIQELCQFVYIDRQRSIGDAHRDASVNVLEHRPRQSLQAQLSTYSGGKISTDTKGFFASIKDIWRAASATKRANDDKDGGLKNSSAIRIEHVRPDGRKQQGMSDIEVQELVGTPATPDYDRGNLFAWLSGLFGSKRSRTQNVGSTLNQETEIEEPPFYSDQTSFEAELREATQAHKKSEEALQGIIEDIRNNKPVSIETAEDAVAWLTESIIRNPDSLSWLVRLKSHNHYTYDHSLSVCVHLLNFGRHIGLSKSILQLLGTAGLLQDLGKIKVAPELLEKESGLTVEECNAIKAHVNHSVELLSGLPRVSSTLLEIVAQHHERHNGTGYPKGLRGEEISMFGAMAGIADEFVGMTSARPYGLPVTPTEALQELYRSRGETFSIDMVQEFIKCVGIWPVGSLVELNSGEAAIVVAHNRTQRRYPRVMLILDERKQPYAKAVMLDLIMRPLTAAGEPYRILRCLHDDAQIRTSALMVAEAFA